MKKFQNRKTSAILTLSLLAMSSIVAIAFAAPAASAETVISITTSNGAAVCPASPLSGTWNSGTDTCSVAGTIVIEPATTLDVGAGVDVAVSGTGISIFSTGTINNDGTVTGSYVGGPGPGIDNGGTINNAGTMIGGGSGDGFPGIFNVGTINNTGTMAGIGINGFTNGNNGGPGPSTIYNEGAISGIGGSDNGEGFINSGTIHNYGSMTGTDTLSGGSLGIENVGYGGSVGTIYNAGTMTGTSLDFTGIGNSGTLDNIGTMTGSGLFGIANSGTFNNYCGATLSSTPPMTDPVNAISCYPVTFEQSGLPTSGVSWGVTVSWLFGTTHYTGTGASINVQNLSGSVIHSYDTPVTSSGITYDCSSSDCSGTTSIGGDTTIVATYSQVTSLGSIASDFSTLQSDLAGNFTILTTGMSALSSELSTDYLSLSSQLTSLSTSVATGFSTVESSLSSLSTSMADGFTTVESELGGISAQLTSLQSTVSSLGNPPQVATGSGEATLTPGSNNSTVFTSPSSQLGSVTLTLNTTGVGNQDSVTVRYYTDPGNPSFYLQQTVASKGDTPLFTTSVAAWKVQILASFGSKAGSISVDWAYSAVEPAS